MKLRTLYPALEPYNCGFLPADGEHRIYYEQSGNPSGKPAVFVHGGPGGGGDVNARRFFDPQRYRIIVFDQRVAGRSRPEASLVNNTTSHLIGDMERLRELLGISRWLVFGGSWGSTLSLAYAQANPAVVSELVVRGIFLLRQKELRWFYQHGASVLFPDQWEHFLAPIPVDERDDLLAAYHRRLVGDDEDAKLAAAHAWSYWEGVTSHLLPDPAHTLPFEQAKFAVELARIETHYFVNAGFFDGESQLLDGIDRIRSIPAVIVQGRYDVVCPMETAWELASRWPEADFRLVDQAGHSAYEPGITHELINVTDGYAT
jgi:proline iminopeptidase